MKKVIINYIYIYIYNYLPGQTFFTTACEKRVKEVKEGSASHQPFEVGLLEISGEPLWHA